LILNLICCNYRRIEMGLLSHVVGTNSTDQEEEHVQKQFQNK
jgi:hypothetical protein